MDIYRLQERSAEEIYAQFCQNEDPDQLFSQGRTQIATRLRVEEDLAQGAAYYAADQILAHAQDLLDQRQAQTEIGPG